mmetsp:Transcript_115366/g.337306  ORF Transcript_115366/g.337306 Transcript_115366/m.337306 type:complete len:594 (-) Transcript_115366:117-1898(-)
MGTGISTACPLCAPQGEAAEILSVENVDLFDERLASKGWIYDPVPPENIGSPAQLQWLNLLIAHTWPQLGQLASHFVEEKIEPLLRKQLSGTVKLKKFAMGERPGRIGLVEVYDLPQGTSCIHVSLDYTSDMEVQWDVRSFTFGIKNFSIVGEIVFLLRPYMEEHPGTGGVTIFFANPPSMNFQFTGLARIAEFKGIKSRIKAVLEEALGDKLVLPHTVSQLMRFSDYSLYPMVMGDPNPIGLLRMKTLTAKDMPSGDITCFGVLGGGVDDNYIKISLGSERWRTKVNKSSLGETHDFFVFDPEQTVNVELWDKDIYTDDDLLGRAGPFSLYEVTTLSEKPMHFADPHDDAKSAGSVTLKVDYYHGAPYTISSALNAIMLPIREVHLPPSKERSRVFVRAELGEVRKDSPMGVVMANRLQDRVVDSVMADVQERLRRHGLPEEEVSKLTSTNGLSCNSCQVTMAINHCMMFMIPEGTWQSSAEVRLSLLEEMENQEKAEPKSNKKRTAAVMEVVLGQCTIKLEELKKADNFTVTASGFQDNESGMKHNVEVSAFLCGFQEGKPEQVGTSTMRKSRRSFPSIPTSLHRLRRSNP